MSKLRMHLGLAITRRYAERYAKEKLGERWLFIVKGNGYAFPHLLKDLQKVKKALRVAGYYVYWPRFMQEWYFFLPKSEQEKYYGFAERTTESVLRLRLRARS